MMPRESSSDSEILNLIAKGLESDGTQLVEVRRQLTPTEAIVYRSASEQIGEFERTRNLLRLVDSNLEELRESLAALASITAQDAVSGHRYGPIEFRVVEAKVVNYLTSVRLYQEHRHRQLKRRYGEGGAPFTAFELARKATFDREPVYRFVYKLRNYVQHCGMPIQVARSSHCIVNTEDSESSIDELFVGCRRSTLLSDYREWGSAKGYIEAQQEEFELFPVLLEHNALLYKIDAASVRAEVPFLWEQARTIARLLDEVANDRYTATVGKVLYSADRKSIEGLRLRDPPLNTLRNLKFIETTNGIPAWRINDWVLAQERPPQVD